MHFKSVIPTLALAASTYAASSSSSSSDVCSSSVTATSQSDLDAIAGCAVFKGDIILSTGLATATLNGVESIQGSLTATNITTLSSIAAPVLANISDTLTLEILEALTVANFPELTAVENLNLVTINKIDSINFAAGISEIDSLVVSDTSLTTLAGIVPTSLSLLNINNNLYLTTIQFPLKSVDELDISSTANSLDISFPDLTTAHNMTFRDAKTINIANVTSINSTLSYVNTTLSAVDLPKVQNIEGTLAIVSNSQLKNISFPVLQSIGGGFQIANNTNLDNLSGFPVLSSVGGAVDFVGDFDQAILPKLNTVRGGVVVDSDAEDFNCSSWNSLEQNNGIRGDSYQCKAKSSSTSIALTSTKTSAASSSQATGATTTASTSKNVAAAQYVLESTSILGALAVFVLQFV